MAWETILNIKNEIQKLYKDQNDPDLNKQYIHQKSKLKSRSDSFTVCVSFNQKQSVDHEFDVYVQSIEPYLCIISYSRRVSLINRNLFNIYIPYAILPYYAERHKKIFVVTHFAQTLDGRIASISGDSKWIGNQENLVHAHRMRALLDGILVGSKTVQSDNPLLSVRHVTGDDPKKIIVGGDHIDIEKYQISEKEYISFSQGVNTKGNNFILDKEKGIYDTSRILNTLYELGLRSLYIEGGSFTTSTFLSQNMIDQVQIHFAPTILGSGVTGFNFKGVQYLKEAIYFKSFRYLPLGNQMMFIGEI
jgi:diaminohydroxyphosphoribosylaminopyrimidine deaminase/5-amino-6-(5-phosphoribosylamino)uracil reductase